MFNLSIERVKELSSKLSDVHIAVIGDVMLDHYYWGSVTRVSPEAPVPVIDLEKETFHLGGAANVAANLRSLGVNVVLYGIAGKDEMSDTFMNKCSQFGIDTSGLFLDEARPTTVKTRIIGNNQHIARLDRENRNPITPKGELFILDQLDKQQGLCGIIFEDYNKGALSENLIKKIISLSKQKNIPVFVDPKLDNFFAYQGATLLKPNKKEAKQALGQNLETEEQIQKAGEELLEKLSCEYALITLGADGMMLFNKDGSRSSVKTRARKVADVSGAGDTVIATLAAYYCAGADIREAATLANNAAGIVVEKPGIVSVKLEELYESIEAE